MLNANMMQGEQAAQPAAVKERMVECQTSDGVVIPVPQRLMMQSRLFAQILTVVGDNDAGQPIDFPINVINSATFEAVVRWMAEHDGQPNPVIQEDPNTGQRDWLPLTEWQRNFFNVDIGTLKTYMMAANFLDLLSLYNYCGQEIARYIFEHIGNGMAREQLHFIGQAFGVAHIFGG